MAITNIIYIAAIVVLTVLMATVSSTTRTKTSLAFNACLLSLLGWIVTLFVYYNETTHSIVLFFGRLNFVFAGAIPVSLLIFIRNYPIRIVDSRNEIIIIIELLLLAVISQFTDLVIYDEIIEGYDRVPIFGALYGLFILHFVLFSLVSIVLLIKKIYDKSLKQKEQYQVRLLLGGLVAAVIYGSFTNIIVPVIFTNSKYFPLETYTFLQNLGTLAPVIFAIPVAYAILRYQFLNIRILIGKITYFSIVAGITYIAFYLSIAINTLLFGSVYATGSYLIGIVIAVLFVVLFNWFNKFVLKQINSRLISPDYDPNEVVANLNSQISTILSYEQISEVTIATLAKTLRSSYEGIIVTRDGNNFDLLSGKKENLALTLPPLVQALKLWKVIGKVPILVDQIELEMPVIFKNMEGMLKEITDEMKDAKLKALYPLGQESQIVGILLIGSKDSEAPYNSVERAFMASIADIAGLALTRAFLYQEVQDFNVTLQHKIELATQEIQDKNKKLQDTINFERDMLDILGHELRTPLGTARNAIMTLQKMSKDKTMKEESTNQLLDMSANQLRREIQLLETILASTKVDNAKLDLNIVKISAQKVIDNSYNVYAVEAKKKNLELSVDVPKEELFCSADELRIQQVIDNIVSNAIKYTPEGTVKIVLEDDGDMVKFSITDTGEGIPESEIPNLGKKFYRVNNYLKSDGKLGDNRKIVRPGGTGIGLYVVFELTKAMKGRVEVKSVVGKGSTFSIYIPKWKQE